MRDNFSNAVKELLAKRVGWQCSFPGCQIPTVGPGHESDSAVVNLGEAAHIYAASPEGPRYDVNMTVEQRKAIENGIWMCRSHARLIDADFINYSSDTLRQWKRIAENNAYKRLRDFERGGESADTLTLVAIGSNIVFLGTWLAAVDEKWTFGISKFIIGDINKLREYNDVSQYKYERYIVVETQGDGRLLIGKLNWRLDGEIYRIFIETAPKIERTTPYDLTDIDANFLFENGDIKIVKGIDCARQQIVSALSLDFGELFYAEDFGSHFSTYFWRFKEDIKILNRLLKLEITRLISLPRLDTTSKLETPPLQFINRILEVEILCTDLVNNKVPLRLKLEWGDGKYWEEEIQIYIRAKEDIGKKVWDSFEESGLSEELFNQIKTQFRNSQE